MKRRVENKEQRGIERTEKEGKASRGVKKEREGRRVADKHSD